MSTFQKGHYQQAWWLIIIDWSFTYPSIIIFCQEFDSNFNGCLNDIFIPLSTKLNKFFEEAVVSLFSPMSPRTWYVFNSSFWQICTFLFEPDMCATIIFIFRHIGWTCIGDWGRCNNVILQLNNIGTDVNILRRTGYQTWFDQSCTTRVPSVSLPLFSIVPFVTLRQARMPKILSQTNLL